MTLMTWKQKTFSIALTISLLLASASAAFSTTAPNHGQQTVKTFLPASYPHTGAVNSSAAAMLQRPLTLQAVVHYGLQHNRSLKAAQKQAAAVSQQVRQAEAGFLPSVNGSYSFTHLSSQPYAAATLPTGHIQFASGYRNTNHWEVDITQPLFTGFALTSQFHIAKINSKIARYDMEQTRLDVIHNIQYGFWHAILGEKLLQVAKDNVKSLKIHRRNAEAYYRQGLTPQNDVLKADVALSEARLRERSAAKQLITLRAQLDQLLDLPLDTRLDLLGQLPPARPVPQLARLYALAEQQRPQYLALTASIRQAGEQIKKAESAYYPHFSIFGQYYREGEDFSASRNEFTNSHNTAVGVQMKWNLFEGGKTRATAREYQYRQRSLQDQQQNLKKQIDVQVEDAYEQLEVAKANIRTTEVALKQARENERMTTLQYKEQLVIFLEVLNAQIFVLQSSVDYYQALYGYQLALADLKRAVGGPL